MSSIVLKIEQGTQRGTGDLCRTCSHSTIARGDQHEIRYCDHLRREVWFEVRTCNDYSERGRTSLHDLYQTAWILEPSKAAKGQFGFSPYSKWKKNNPDDPYAY